MKNKIFKGLLSLILITMALPAQSQDFMNIYFKKGTLRTFHFSNIEEIYVSHIGEDGTTDTGRQFQHVKTYKQDYAYDLAEIDSITFTKYSEIVAKRNTEKALSALLPELKDCHTITDVQGRVETIKHLDAIESVWIEGDVLYIKIQESSVIKFYFDQGVDINLENQAKLDNLLSTKKIPRYINDDNGNKRKAVVANQQHFDRSTWRINQQNDFMYPLVSKLQEAGYNARYEETPDLDFFYSDMFENDVVFISTHGGYSEATGHSFLSGTKLGEISKNADTTGFDDLMTERLNELFKDNRFANCSDELSVGYAEETRINDDGSSSLYYVAYVDMNEDFFRFTVPGQFPSEYSILFNAACRSLQDNHDLANVFIDHHNLGTYLGYTESNYYGQEAGCTFLLSMLDGLSADKAYSDLANHNLNLKTRLETVVGTYKDEDITKFNKDGEVEKQYIASIEIVPEKFNTKLRYITPVHTLELSQDKVNEMYYSNKSITVQSITTSLHPENISMGFYWGDYDTDGVIDIPATVHYKTLDTGKGGLVFSATIKDLIPGKTYHYRAYTYDGLHYNYGDIGTFKIDEKQSDTRVQMLTGTVNNATYSIYKEITDESDYHENPDGWKCYRSKLTLDITKNGTTNTYVVDDNIYLDKETQHHGGQVPCMMLDYNKNKMYIFCNSKDDQPYYSMDGNFYSSSINSISFSKETVFEGANFGWYPYFRDSGNDEIHLCNFSYAGYFTILAKRSTSNEWTLYYDNPEITPEDAIKEWEQVPHILVIGTP